MSWFSKYVGDPLKALLAKAEAAVESDLKALAGQVAGTLPAAPVTAAAETAFVTSLQSAADTLLISTLGAVPVAGAALTPEAEAAANAAIAYLVQKGGEALNALAAEAKATLAKAAGTPAAVTAQTAAAATVASQHNPTAASMGAGG